ncbi:MAG: GAF domain-containing protein, partial [Bacteroidales bacterium]|nr:GAF domain-containing protein [Bacteroidales bacterium]
MEKQERQNIVGQSVMLYFAIMVIMLVVGILLDFMQHEDYDWNLQSLIHIFGNNYLIWVLILLIAIIPIITYFTVRSHIDQIVKLKGSLSSEFKKLTKVEDFIENLIKNNFKTTISDTFKKDVTFQKLEQLRDKMKNNKRIVDKQRREDERRNWHAEGLAKFGEILRDNSNDMEALGYNVVKNLIEYLDAIQGGFYILEEDAGDKYFDLVAFYAYGRKKYADKHIEYGKGLLGTCAMERETIYLKKIPNSYITVTSGLGQANPKNLLLCPLITETELFGVLELASMNDFSEIQIGFVEKVSESIASTISTVRMNMRTSELLKETSEQAQALLAQEEEMRQNMEELQATQEEAGRQAQRFMRLETTVNHTM